MDDYDIEGMALSSQQLPSQLSLIDGELRTQNAEEELFESQNEVPYDDENSMTPSLPWHDESYLQSLSLKQLNEICLEKGMKTYGSKKEMIARYLKIAASMKAFSSPSNADCECDSPNTKGKNWTMNEDLRLLHVLSDPECLPGVRKALDGYKGTRAEIDNGTAGSIFIFFLIIVI